MIFWISHLFRKDIRHLDHPQEDEAPAKVLEEWSEGLSDPYRTHLPSALGRDSRDRLAKKERIQIFL